MRVDVALLSFLLVATAAPLARAGDNKSDPKYAARALAEHGYALYEAGKYQEALTALEQAERLFHAPTLLFAIARAQAAMGRLVEARATYQRVVDEKLAPGAPQAFRDAQTSSKDAVAALDKRIPLLRIAVRGGGGRALRVTLDGAEVDGWRADRDLPANPGAHQITVVPLGGVGMSRSVDLAEGARAVVEIELPGAAPIIAAAPAAPPPDAPRPWLVPSLASFGVGALGLGLGIGAGVVTLSKASALKARCPTGTCPYSDQNQRDVGAANAMGTAATVGVVLAGAGVATGVVLLVVKPGSRREARAALDVGPGSIRITGVF
jgi:hypothetical protein